MKWKKIEFFFYLNNCSLWISFYLHSHFYCWKKKRKLFLKLYSHLHHIFESGENGEQKANNFFLIFKRMWEISKNLTFHALRGEKKNFQQRSNFFHKRHIIKIHLQRSILLSWEVSRKHFFSDSGFQGNSSTKNLCDFFYFL